MDKVVDSGSTDTGSIPVRDARRDFDVNQSLFYVYKESNPRGHEPLIKCAKCTFLGECRSPAPKRSEGGRRRKHSEAVRDSCSGRQKDKGFQELTSCKPFIFTPILHQPNLF